MWDSAGDKMSLVHHFVGFLSIYLLYFFIDSQPYMIAVGVALLIMEVTTPFTTLRFFLKQAGYNDSHWS